MTDVEQGSQDHHRHQHRRRKKRRRSANNTSPWGTSILAAGIVGTLVIAVGLCLWLLVPPFLHYLREVIAW